VERFPLFKGATRIATVHGVPTVPLILMLITVACVTLLTSLWWALLAGPLWLVMAAITKSDDRAFRIWGLWIETKMMNRNKRFWGASSYSPVVARRE